ncbi:MAG TPA: hypothetical protein VGR20_05900 [Acidimicrobiia bacterium]|nr:hypothetical protein [Acidimicrobiia bacterium]
MPGPAEPAAAALAGPAAGVAPPVGAPPADGGMFPAAAPLAARPAVGLPPPWRVADDGAPGRLEVGTAVPSPTAASAAVSPEAAATPAAATPAAGSPGAVTTRAAGRLACSAPAPPAQLAPTTHTAIRRAAVTDVER